MIGALATAAATRATSEPAPPRVFVAVADDLVRVGVSRLLADEGFQVVGADAEPDVVLALCSPGETIAALRAGANAVVDRASPPAAIFAAVRSATAGCVVMPAEAAGAVLASHPVADVTSSLSAREREVLRLVAQGLANDEIARELVVTTSTVKNHVARLMEKLGARNRTQAAVIGAGLTSG